MHIAMYLLGHGPLCSISIYKLHLKKPLWLFYGYIMAASTGSTTREYSMIALRLLHQSRKNKHVCSSYGSLSFLPGSWLTPCLPQVQWTVRYGKARGKILAKIWRGREGPMITWERAFHEEETSVLEHARLVLRNSREVLVAGVEWGKRMNTRKPSQKGNEVGTDSRGSIWLCFKWKITGGFWVKLTS